MKRRINITLDEKIHIWAQDFLKKDGDTLSGFFELKLIELSCSVALLSGTIKQGI